jgi:hypothetical protein
VPAALVEVSAVLIFEGGALLGTMRVMMMMSSCPVSIVSSEASEAFFRWVARGGLPHVEVVPIMGFLLMLMMLMAVIAPAGATSFSLFGVSLVVFEPLSDRQGAYSEIKRILWT